MYLLILFVAIATRQRLGGTVLNRVVFVARSGSDKRRRSCSNNMQRRMKQQRHPSSRVGNNWNMGHLYMLCSLKLHILRMMIVNHNLGRHLLSLLELVNNRTAFVKVLCCFPLLCPALCLMMQELGVIMTQVHVLTSCAPRDDELEMI